MHTQAHAREPSTQTHARSPTHATGHHEKKAGTNVRTYVYLHAHVCAARRDYATDRTYVVCFLSTLGRPEPGRLVPPIPCRHQQPCAWSCGALPVSPAQAEPSADETFQPAAELIRARDILRSRAATQGTDNHRRVPDRPHLVTLHMRDVTKPRVDRILDLPFREVPAACVGKCCVWHGGGNHGWRNRLRRWRPGWLVGRWLRRRCSWPLRRRTGWLVSRWLRRRWSWLLCCHRLRRQRLRRQLFGLCGLLRLRCRIEI